MVNMETISVLDMEEDIAAKALALALPLLAVSLPTIYTALPYFHGFWKVYWWWLGDFRCTRVVVEGHESVCAEIQRAYTARTFGGALLPTQERVQSIF